MLSIVLLLPLLQALELPLAPYNVKVFCRQGRRYSHGVHTAVQCPSSTTACGFFEFRSKDVVRGIDKTGVYECVDNGILKTNDYNEEEDELKFFTQLCGATPQCSYLNLNKLNTAFIKYLIVNHNIQLESLTSHTIRFCCSLFHHTLQKLVTSEKDRLPVISAPPVHCESEVCEADAVGCLLHSLINNEESDEYYDDNDDDEDDDDEDDDRRQSVRQKRNYDGQRLGHDEQINAVQLFFDFEEEDEHDPSLEFSLRTPSSSKPFPSSELRLNELNRAREMVRNLSRSNRSGTVATTTSSVRIQNGDYEELDDMEEVHCVYRHLNDELYRYCLLVHQRKDGDRCYQHEGHTICCCFVPPDKETCDPTEIDIVRPPVLTRFSSIRVTPWPKVAKIVSAATESSSTTTTTASTTTTVHTSTSVSRTTPTAHIGNAKPHSRTRFSAPKSPLRNRCRVTYPRRKTSGSRVRPVLVCDYAHSVVNCLFFSMLLFQFL